MSFQSFCGKDPDEAVSYQKILPQFLPSNAPTASTIRITTAGATNIPAPTIQNESLYVIDTAGIDATFTYNSQSIPDGTRNYTSLVPIVNTGDNTKISYLVANWKFVSDSPETFAYEVSRWNNPSGGWGGLFQTDDNKTISCICNVNPHFTDGGKPTPADTFLIVGNFATLGGVACPNGYAVFDPVANTITPYVITTAMPDPTDFPYVMIPLPAVVGGGFIAAFRNPANYNRIARLQGGIWSAIAPNTGMDATDKNNILTLCFDEPNGILYIGGYFVSFNVNGVAAPNSAGIVALGYNGGTNDWRTNVPLPNIQPLYAYSSNCGVESITLAYDPTDGIFVIGTFQNATATSAFFSPSIASQIVPLDVPKQLINLTGMFLIGIDKNNWVGATEQRCFGVDAGGAVIEFGSGCVAGFTWFWNAPIAEEPLSYFATIGFGSYQIGTETTLNFTDANLRYCKTNGVSGLATSVVLTSNFASLFVIGDPASSPPVWDMVSNTGLLTFVP